jgi:hypothetical protein
LVVADGASKRMVLGDMTDRNSAYADCDIAQRIPTKK